MECSGAFFVFARARNETRNAEALRTLRFTEPSGSNIEAPKVGSGTVDHGERR